MLTKYPRTPHLPWSPGRTKDDRVLDSIDHFIGRHIVVSIKMDGECSTLYRDHLHARSLDSGDHPSRHWLKGFWASIRYLIPEGWRICGENLFAKHSIHYKDLESYFYVFSIWNEKNTCLSYWQTRDLCDIWCLTHVQTIYDGLWSTEFEMFEFLNARFEQQASGQEGYVVRIADEFHYDAFNKSVAKYVRENHVQTEKHWMYEEITPNKLRK